MKIYKVLVFAVIVQVSFCGSASASEPTPRDYDDVKALLDKYASQIDLPTEDGIAARKAMQAKADQSVPALKILFDEIPDDRYRVEIVSLFRHTSSSRIDAMSFLFARLSSVGDQRNGHRWARAAFEALVVFDAKAARIAARKALGSSDPFLQVAAIQTLARVGDIDDVNRLDN